MRDHADSYPIEAMSKVLGVSVAGYYDWKNRKPSMRDTWSAMILAAMLEIYKQQRGLIGSPTMTDLINKAGLHVNHKCIERLMKENGLYAVYRLKFKKATTNSNHKMPVSSNLLKRNFRVEKPNKVWVSDITYIKTKQGWLYLCIVIDLFSRKAVGWSMDTRMATKLVADAFLMAYKTRKPKAWELIFHSDRGSQYCSREFRRLLRRMKVISSMSKAGDCYDNACAESWFGLLKRELIYMLNTDDQQKIRTEVFEYIEVFYNRQRVHSTINNMTPEEYELKAA